MTQLLEATIVRGRNRQRAVIKIGSSYDLRNEYSAWDQFVRRTPTPCFVPIQAVSKKLVGQPAPAQDWEVVIYSHAAEYQASTDLQMLEAIAQQAVQSDEVIYSTEKLIAALFDGIRRSLYDHSQINEQSQSLRSALNESLGFAATVTVNRVEASASSITLSSDPLPSSEVQYSAQVVTHALGKAPQTLTHLAPTRAKLEWWGKQLVARIESDHLLLLVEGSSNRVPLVHAPELRELETPCFLSGPLSNWRGELCQQRLRHWLGPDFVWIDGGLSDGDKGRVPDPFAWLLPIMEARFEGRVTSVVHGDLNPRNVLVVGDRPCVIDYANTKSGQPLLSDFARLEANLMVEAVPAGCAASSLTACSASSTNPLRSTYNERRCSPSSKSNSRN